MTKTINNLGKLRDLILQLKEDSTVTLLMKRYIPQNFDVSKIKSGTVHDCGSTCCLLGHSTKIFPVPESALRLVEDYSLINFDKFTAEHFPDLLAKNKNHNIELFDSLIAMFLFDPEWEDSWELSIERLDILVQYLKKEVGIEVIKTYFREKSAIDIGYFYL